jgi:hypothetical protein
VFSEKNVVAEGIEDPARRPDRRPWGWLVAGLLIGAAASVLLLRVEAEFPPIEPTTAGQGSIPTSREGIGDVIPGFPDGLVTTARADGRSLELVIWPKEGEPFVRAIPVGAASPPNPVAFDASGRRIATILPLTDEPYGVLYGGVPENAAIVEVDVTGYAWHDSVAGALAYTTFVDEELFLWTASGSLRSPELMSRAIGIEGGVAAWGDWGFAIQDERRGSIVLLTDGGEIKDSQVGVVLDSHQSGWLAIADDGLKLLSAGGGVRGVDSFDAESSPLTARFSSDRRMLAVLTIDGLSVLSLDDGTEVVRSELRSGVASQVIWTSDDRFALYPGSRGVVVVDSRDLETRELMVERTFTGLGILPLSGS